MSDPGKELVSHFSDWGTEIESTTTTESAQLRRAAETCLPGSCDTAPISESNTSSSSHHPKNIAFAKGGNPIVKSSSCNLPETEFEKSLISNKTLPTSLSDNSMIRK